MKVIFLGTPDFAVKPLRAIIESQNHQVVGVVTQPDRPVGRKNIITPPPVKVVANEYNIPVFQYEKIRAEGVDDLKSLNADIMITCAYGQILSREIIDICRYGIINIHASLLPKYRGAAPIQYAIINGEKTTGVTVMQTEEGLDTGDILEAFETPIGETETAAELFERLSNLGAQNICAVLDKIESGNIVKTKQDDSLATVVKTIKKEDATVDFSKNCETVKNLINGMNPWPVAYTYFGGKKLKFYRAGVAMGQGEIGEVIRADKKLVVACGEGAVEILEIQEEGGKAMSALSYLNGRKLKVGDILGR
ncbi:MAG: methionyl-tRNA formyltransferase [Clostridiales bacterium]|nr:methionyl-tRNA formyltransferase [Clostridiales bacterium]